MRGNLDLGGYKIVSHGTPTESTDVVHKSYVDDVPFIWLVSGASQSIAGSTNVRLNWSPTPELMRGQWAIESNTVRPHVAGLYRVEYTVALGGAPDGNDCVRTYLEHNILYDIAPQTASTVLTTDSYVRMSGSATLELDVDDAVRVIVHHTYNGSLSTPNAVSSINCELRLTWVGSIVNVVM